MKRKIFAFIKGVYKSMTNKAAEVIDAVRMLNESKYNQFSNTAKDSILTAAESNKVVAIGLGVISAGIGIIGIGASIIFKGISMKNINIERGI